MRRCGRGDDDVTTREVRFDRFERDRLSVESRGELLRVIVRAIGDENLLESRAVQMLGSQLADFAGAQKEGLQAAELAENLARQLAGRVGNRDGMLTDARVCAHLLRNVHRSFEEAL